MSECAGQYERVCKDEFSAIHAKLDRLDRLERFHHFFWFIFGAAMSTSIGVVVRWIGR